MNNLPTLEEQLRDLLKDGLFCYGDDGGKDFDWDIAEDNLKQALIIAEQRGMHRMVEGEETPNYFDTTV